MDEDILFELVVKRGPQTVPLMFNMSIFFLLFLVSLSDWLSNNVGMRRSEGTILFQQVCSALGAAFSLLVCACGNGYLILGATFLLFYLTVFFFISPPIKEKNKETSENKKRNRRTYEF